jgi:hypothetical protein
MCNSVRFANTRANLANDRGQVVQYQTTGSTLDGLLLPESLKLVWNEIPKVIRDAIDFTDRIGERYLWVDSLCIVQDAPSKHMQIQHMAEIYNSATMTLMACVGKKADDALRLISPVRPKRPKRPTEISYTDTSSSEDDGEYHLDDQEAQGAQDGLPRKSRPLQIPQRPSKEMQQEIKMEIARSHHNSRGWTYQERMLSRRRLFFLPSGLVYQCRVDIFSPKGFISAEGRPAADPESHSRASRHFRNRFRRIAEKDKGRYSRYVQRRRQLMTRNCTLNGPKTWINGAGKAGLRSGPVSWRNTHASSSVSRKMCWMRVVRCFTHLRSTPAGLRYKESHYLCLRLHCCGSHSERSHGVPRRVSRRPLSHHGLGRDGREESASG